MKVQITETTEHEPADESAGTEDARRPAFAVGAVVRLKSGGLPMTVSMTDYVKDEDRDILPDEVECCWHDVNGEPQENKYDVRMIEPMAIERQGQQPLSEPMNSGGGLPEWPDAGDWRKSRGL